MIKNDVLNHLAISDKRLVRSKDGSFTISIDDVFLHSKYSPVKEARRLVEDIISLDPAKTFVIVLGAGLGYHIEELEKAGFHNILVIERNIGAFEIFSKIFDCSQIPFIVSPDKPVEFIDSVFSNLKIENFKDIKTIMLRGGYLSDIYSPLEERIKRIVKVKLGDFTTRLKFEEVWFINILANIKNLRNSYTVKSLIDGNRTSGCPVLVISAGPSLKFSIETIRSISDYAVTIAVDTAVMPLFEAGIIPDFVFSLDSQPHNIPDFSMIDRDYLSRITLVYDTVVNPKLPFYFPGRKIISNTSHLDFDYKGNPFVMKSGLVEWIEHTGNFTIGDIETGGSVATSAFHLAYLLGGDPVILIGQDLAYSYKVSHSPSTPHFYRVLGMVDRLVTIESLFLSVLLSRRAFPTKGIDGEIYTDFVLDNFRGWFDESARSIAKIDNKEKLINASLNGAEISNFKSVSHSELINTLSKRSKIDKSKLFLGLKLIDSLNVDKLIYNLKNLGCFVDNLGVVPSVFDKIEKSEFGFLNRYFMKEQMVFERYASFDELNFKRKVRRLLKNIFGVIDGD
jgi:hypothetical protein